MEIPPADEDKRMNRRRFIGAVGAVAAAAALPQQTADAEFNVVMYHDSFGNNVPAAKDALAAGLVPPPLGSDQPRAIKNVTYKQPGYSSPNILMIMVDQLRAPRWLPTTGGQSAIDRYTPTIANLRDHSFVFDNYFVAATDCTPSRATLLTGLYSQQTCMFITQINGEVPALQTGYPTFASALNQTLLGYDVTWIGKWHVSDAAPDPAPPSQAPANQPGVQGPYDYGFSSLSFPSPNADLHSKFASPNGLPNEGTDGYHGNTIYGPQLRLAAPGYLANSFSDSAIADWFVNTWLPNAPSSNWCTTVSFINPHDMSDFPYTYGPPNQTDFGPPCTTPPIPKACKGTPIGFEPPSPGGGTNIPPLTVVYGASNPPGPYQGSNWNVEDVPTGYNNGAGKPDLQSVYQNYINNATGSVLTAQGWYTFLNYYLWMQSCVDYQIGRVISALQASPFWNNTVILFTSDHGDYGGSHSLHAKGGALYDESLNTPLYISYPPMRANYNTPGHNTSMQRSFLCSSVDIFAFMYETALGNGSWRTNPNDPYYYLNGRESIADAVQSSSPVQRRLTTIPNSAGTGYLPYVLHTTDEFTTAAIGGKPVPTHAIALRTVDVTVTPNAGAKLGIYSFWVCNETSIDQSKQSQLEFYDYGALNFGEIGNGAYSGGALSAGANVYLQQFKSLDRGELYNFDLPPVAANRQAALALYLNFVGSTC